MQDSTVYRSILAEGKLQGKEESQREFVLNSLREGLSIEIVARITGLSIEQVQQLSESSEN